MTSTETTTSRATAKRYGDEEYESSSTRTPFVAVFRRNGVAEEHEFTAEPHMDYKAMVGLVSGQNEATLRTMDRTIRQSLVNDDGAPLLSWAGEEANEDESTFTEWSSRRRWVHLMDADDEVTIHERVIMAMFQDLVKEASKGRPTKRSAPTSR